MALNIDPQLILGAARAELDTVAGTLRDKGAKRFTQAFGLAGICVAVAYFGIYAPPQKKISRLAREIEKAKAMSEVGAQYTAIRNQLAAAYAALPQSKDREQWLNNAMIDSLRADNLTPDSFRPVNETEINGLIFQSSTVQLTVKFEEFYAWLTRLEGAKPLMHLQTVELQKKSEQLGWNGVTCEVTTVVPKKRFN